MRKRPRISRGPNHLEQLLKCVPRSGAPYDCAALAPRMQPWRHISKVERVPKSKRARRATDPDIQSCAFSALLRRRAAATPARPVPSSAMLIGSGTVELGGMTCSTLPMVMSSKANTSPSELLN